MRSRALVFIEQRNMFEGGGSRNGVTAAHVCVMRGNRAELRKLVEESDARLEEKDHFGRTPLFYSVMVDDPQCLSFLLKAGARVDNGDNNGQTALHLAARKGLKVCIKLLLGAQALWNHRDADGVTSLHLAASNRRSKGLALILDQVQRGQVDLQDERKQTALHWSAFFCNADNILMLLNEDANVLLQDEEGRTPLHLCAGRPDPAAIDCIRILLESEPSLVKWQDYQGCTALHLAVASGTTQVIDYLTSRNHCDIDPMDNLFRTPLHWAALLGSVDVVKLLLERGADPSSGDCNGATPLHCAARLKDPAVATLLLTRGAPWDKRDAHGLSPLLWAAIGGASRVVRALHAHGAPLHVPAANGITALHAAASQGQHEVVQLLLDLGLSLGLRDSMGLGPLSHACQAGHAHTVQLLLDAGAKVRDADTRGLSPLHWAVIGDHAYVCQLLAQHGCRMDALDAHGRTALHYASIRGLSGCMAILLQHKADPNILDYEGKTALHLAAQFGSLEAVELLCSYGVLVNAMDETHNRFTALDYAATGSHIEIRCFLQEQGAVTSESIQIVAATTIQKFFRRICSRKKMLFCAGVIARQLKEEALVCQTPPCLSQPDAYSHSLEPANSKAKLQDNLRYAAASMKTNDDSLVGVKEAQPFSSRSSLAERVPAHRQNAAFVIQRAWHRYVRLRLLERMQQRILNLFENEEQRQAARLEWERGLAHLQLFAGPGGDYC